MADKIFVIKPVGTRCNLRCEYCYNRNKSSGGKTVINDRAIEEFVRQYLTFPQSTFQFIWHGGEPTLAGIDFFEKVISLQQFYGKGKKISNEIQTNATLLNEKWIYFFERNRFHIGVSIDGPQEIHDAYRKDHSGKGSFKKVMQGISLLKESKLQWGALVVLTDKSLGSEEQIFDFLVSNEIYNFDLLPITSLNKKTNGSDDHSISPEEFTEIIVKIFTLWWELDDPNIQIRLFNETIQVILKEAPLRCICNSPGCANYLTLDWDGTIYPCEAFMEIEDFNLGNILDSTLKEILTNSRYQNFATKTKELDLECSHCKWWQICPGRCIFDQYKFGENLAEKDFLCAFRKMFFPYLEKKIKEVKW
jgi:uncharacterized protein